MNEFYFRVIEVRMNQLFFIITLIISRHFSSEKSPTITVASFFFFFFVRPTNSPFFVHYALLPKVLSI